MYISDLRKNHYIKIGDTKFIIKHIGKNKIRVAIDSSIKNKITKGIENEINKEHKS